MAEARMTDELDWAGTEHLEPVFVSDDRKQATS